MLVDVGAHSLFFNTALVIFLGDHSIPVSCQHYVELNQKVKVHCARHQLLALGLALEHG